MHPLATLLRSWGNAGARANASAAMAARQREDWLVRGLALRLDRAAAATASHERATA